MNIFTLVLRNQGGKHHYYGLSIFNYAFSGLLTLFQELAGAIIGAMAVCSLHGKLGAFRTVLPFTSSRDNVEHSNYSHTFNSLYFL